VAVVSDWVGELKLELLTSDLDILKKLNVQALTEALEVYRFRGLNLLFLLFQ
jgi:hypothetical protein